jgi:hypothetical protein
MKEWHPNRIAQKLALCAINPNNKSRLFINNSRNVQRGRPNVTMNNKTHWVMINNGEEEGKHVNNQI